MYAVMDMIGNLWERCLTGWNQEIIDINGYTYRFIKGGAWNKSDPDHLRANEARYFMNKYKHELMVVPANESQETIDYVHRILKAERNITFSAKPLETSRFQVENIKWTYVFYEDGIEVNVMDTVDNPKKRAVGFKLSEGMEIPKELEGK